MPRVHQVKKARKNQKQSCNRCHKKIKKGDSYYWWANRIGRSSIRKANCSSCGYPRASQLTTSDKLSEIYGAQESAQDAVDSWDGSDPSDVAEALREAASSAEDVKGGYEEGADNQEQYFPGSQQVEESREKGEQCGTWGEELENVASEIESMEKEDEETDEDFQQKVRDRASEAIDSLEIG